MIHKILLVTFYIQTVECGKSIGIIPLKLFRFQLSCRQLCMYATRTDKRKIKAIESAGT